MKPESVRLFVKPGCPWCEEAVDWLESNGIKYEVLDVIASSEARDEMHELTGQTRAPSIEVDGQVLADFDADELEAWWESTGFSV